MKGLDLAEKYFFECGLPMLENHFGEYLRRVAAGLIGPGSECYGFDDHWSRDHDWGPGFCLWLSGEDFARIGERLTSAYEALPKTFKGYGPRQSSPGEEHRVGVIEIDTFYKTYTGLDHPPEDVQEWLSIPEEALSVSTNGSVFRDPLGRFSDWREKLKQYYPEEVRVYKIAMVCVRLAQSGQYNFPRSFKRGERFAQRYAEIQFCNDVLSLTFLLNKQYAPFYKWRHRSARDLPVLGEFVCRNIPELLETDDGNRKIEYIEKTCHQLINALKIQGLTEQDSEFVLDHIGSITERLTDRSLRNRFSMVKGKQ